MIDLLRPFVSLALACALTWWVLYHAPVPVPGVPAVPVSRERPAVEVRPVVEEVVAVKSAPDVPAPVPREPDVEPADVEPPEPEESSPPPPEAGARSGSEDGDLATAPGDAPVDPPSPDEPAARSVGELARDTELLEVAELELRGEAAIGFSTVFVSAPEDQLAIASAFGEDVVLVPLEALDPDSSDAVSYRLNLTRGARGARVESLPGRPPLERYRQYRDLFAYDFARLPEPLRDLRKAVVRRDRVFLFAALIPPSEWAIVVGRRREALATLQLDEGDVERFVMRYVADPATRRTPSPQYDIRVDEIVLADGTRHRPQP